MTTPHDDSRVGMFFRVSAAERERIRTYAAEEGVTVQTYLERRALNEPHRMDRPHGRSAGARRRQRQEELPLTG